MNLCLLGEAAMLKPFATTSSLYVGVRRLPKKGFWHKNIWQKALEVRFSYMAVAWERLA